MEGDERRSWTLLTSHGHVLVEIARNPKARVRDISAVIGITDRSTQAIISDLERAGYVQRVRTGRRTHYVLNADNPFRHGAERVAGGAVPGAAHGDGACRGRDRRRTARGRITDR